MGEVAAAFMRAEESPFLFCVKKLTTLHALDQLSDEEKVTYIKFLQAKLLTPLN